MASTDCQREGQATVELGAKFDLSLDSEGYGRIEKISFAAYNESGCLIEAIERFKERTGYYLERFLADQIYWTREKQKLLQGAWDPVIRSKAGQTKRHSTG